MSTPEHGSEPPRDVHAARARPIGEFDAEAYVALLERIDRESSFLLWEPGERSYEHAGCATEGVKVGAIRVPGAAADECVMGQLLGA